MNCLCPHNDMLAEVSHSFAATQEQETFPVGSSTPKHIEEEFLFLQHRGKKTKRK